MTAHDLAWGRRTGGRLTARDEAALLLSAAGTLVAQRLVRARPTETLVVAEQPPDSAFARRCLAVAQERSGRELLGHCLRTWLWADLTAQLDRVAHDPELLYAACLLHDLGLVPDRGAAAAPTPASPTPASPTPASPTPASPTPGSPSPAVASGCFAVDGALEAHAVATTEGYPRAGELADAVALHLDVTVPLALGAEAHLLHAGAGLDVLAVGLRRVPPAARAAVLGRHPRDGFAATLQTSLAEEAVRRPRSRTGVMQRRLGFTDRVVAADALFCR